MRFRVTIVSQALAALAVGLIASHGAAQAAWQMETDSRSREKDIPGAIAKVDAMMISTYAQQKISSYTIGVVSGPNLIWTKSYGMADDERKIPATRDTVYRIGSVTKLFTALMLRQLIAEGKVHLSDPVEKYFPEFKRIPSPYPAAAPITILQLATHRSGLFPGPDETDAAYMKGPTSEWQKNLIAILPHLRYIYEPGTRYSYSNVGYQILAAVLERIAGERFIAYVQKHELSPLGLDHTGFPPVPGKSGLLAKGYDVVDGKADPSVADNELKYGRGARDASGGMFSTIGDLAKFFSFQMGDLPNKDVLPESQMKDYFSELYFSDIAMTQGYGVAIMAKRDGNTVSLGHTGHMDGYSTYVAFDPKTHFGIILLHSALWPGSDEKLAYKALEFFE